ncbi:zinc finger protein 830 [Salminus brasiliensis]|uniref:zinc finger protein 830 n=1 Tax=Salminus brasiliensis TaxID=930266 RepID=UPI003B838153
MSSRGKKKAVSQEELRRLMKEKQRAAERQRQRRVQSPFAKYTSAGRLMCTLCGEHVKSEAVWQAHVLGRGHKERVGQLKGGQGHGGSAGRRKDEEEEEEENGGVKEVEKRKREEEEEKEREDGVGKKAKTGGLPADFFQSKGAAGLGLLAGQYGGDDDDEEEEEEEEEPKGESVKTSVGASKPPGDASGLPADFFESTLPPDAPSESTDEAAKPEPQLPEGFFDDPVKDARVRNVDTPREQMDREWEEFQKEMRMVNTASDAIVAEDDEEGRIERQIDEIDEQIECFRRVELLRARQEAAQSRTAKQKEEENLEDQEGEEEDEEEDEEKLLHVLSRDWRAKGALA